MFNGFCWCLMDFNWGFMGVDWVSNGNIMRDLWPTLKLLLCRPHLEQLTTAANK